jgi:hypothetical protein
MGFPSLSDVTNSVSNAYNSARDAVSDTVDTVSKTASSAATAVTETVSNTASAVSNTVSSTYNTASTAVRDFGNEAVERASDLGQAGLDAGRRAVDAVQNFDVREAAATARSTIGEWTEAGRQGISDATSWSSERVGDAADFVRANVDGDDLASQAVRGLVTGVENNARFSLGVTGGVAREVVGTAGAVGQLGVTVAEMQAAPEAAAEYGQAIAGFVGDAGQATGNYLSSVAQDPSRLGGDLQGAWDATSGFVGDTADRYGTAIAEGRMEEIGMDVGTVATYVVPIGGGPARGAATALVREGGEALARTGTQALAREGGEAVVRSTATNLAEQRGAALVERMAANGGTAPLEQGAGRVADVAAASRLSGREVAVYRDAAQGRMIAMGEPGAVQVPAGSRIIAHTQPGTGAAALAPSGADLAGLGALGQRSSYIIDEAGGLARFGIDDAARVSAPRAGAGEAVTFQAPTRAAAAAAKPALLPGEGLVGTYDDLIKAGAKGDNITPHHIPSANRMAQEGVAKGDGIAINMEHPHPGSGGRHRETFTYGTQADMNMTPRQALDAGVDDARRIYQSQGLYTPAIEAKLQAVIDQNLAKYPAIFAK